MCTKYLRDWQVCPKVMRGKSYFLGARKMRTRTPKPERRRRHGDRTTRKQETIKANCWRDGGREARREDGCCHIPQRNERNRENVENFLWSGKIWPSCVHFLQRKSGFLWSPIRLRMIWSGNGGSLRGHIDPTATSKGMPNENMQRSLMSSARPKYLFHPAYSTT